MFGERHRRGVQLQGRELWRRGRVARLRAAHRSELAAEGGRDARCYLRRGRSPAGRHATARERRQEQRYGQNGPTLVSRGERASWADAARTRALSRANRAGEDQE